ncbi:MAG TPA: hypothetical protein VLS89_21140 [Candidatus Nanopelagicales bacterium]|nr:hypothetical protein [Candidatus Nanopelagicales bacterium]
MPRQSSKRARAGAARKATGYQGSPGTTQVFDEDLHVLDLGRGVLLDVFINVEGRLTTFLSVDGQLLGELRVMGQA